MKIFLDWMHRKLHPMDVKYTQVPQKKGEEEEEIAEMVAEEKEALLLHDMLRGILTIGTFGQYEDPFLPSLQPFEGAIIGLEEEKEEEEVVIEEPLGVINKKDYEDEKEEEEITIRLKSRERVFEIETKLEDLPLLKEDKERRERVRTTLADLFAADPAVREDAANANKGTKKSSNGDCKQSSHKNKKKEEKKKKTTDGKSSSKLLKLMMTRMLKKKIHPESITSAEAAAAKSIDKHDVSSNKYSFSLVYW